MSETREFGAAGRAEPCRARRRTSLAYPRPRRRTGGRRRRAPAPTPIPIRRPTPPLAPTRTLRPARHRCRLRRGPRGRPGAAGGRPCGRAPRSRSARASTTGPDATAGHQLRAVGGRRGVRRGLPVRRRRHRDPRPADRADPRGVARLRAGRAARAALRLPGARPLGPVDGRPLESGEAAARPVRAGGGRLVRDGRPRCTGTCGTGRSRRSPTPCATTATRRRSCPRAWSSRTTTTGQDDHRPKTPWSDTVIYELHVARLHQAAPGHPAGAARHLRRAGAPGGRRAPDPARA